MYDCRVCEKKFSKFILLEGHFAFSNKCRSKANIFLQCYVCKKSFQHSATLKYHLQLHSTKHLNKQHKQIHSQWSDGNIKENLGEPNHHRDASGRTEFKCNKCEGSFRTRFALHRHMINHNNINISKSKTRHAPSPTISSVLFRCKVCKIFLGSRKRLATHENVHVNGKSNCEICQIKFTEKSLRWHNKLSHPHLITIRSISKPPEKSVFIEQNETQNGKSRVDESPKNKVNVKLPKTSLACEICNIMCENRKRLDCHLKVHVDGQFKCEICNIWFTKRSLDMHEKRLHPHARKQRKLEALRNPKPRKRFEIKRRQVNYAHQCSFCKLVFINEKQLENHVRIHIYGDVECEICKIRFTKRSLEVHMRRRHAEQLTQQIILKALERHNVEHDVKQNSEAQEKKNKYRYHCSVCKLPLLNTKALDIHMKVHIDGNVECKICNIRFTKRSLFRHERRCHPQLQTKTIILKSQEGQLQTKAIILKSQEGHVSNLRNEFNEISPYRYPQKCSVCKLFCVSKAALDIHMRVHIEGDVECKICRISFTKRSLRLHERRRHPGLQTKLKNSIDRSVTKQHTDIKEKKSAYRYQCSVCKLFFISTKTMDTHMKVHIYGNVECKICRIRFTRRSLNIHERRRHPELLVTKPFITKPEVNVTEKRNGFNEISPYRYIHKCSVCKLFCVSKAALDIHMRVHIDGDVECKICRIRFTKRSLNIHKRRRHPNLLVTKPFITKPEVNVTAKRNGFNEISPYRYIHKCSVCKLFCVSKAALENHIRVHIDGDVECKICRIRFTKRSLNIHNRRRHPNLLVTKPFITKPNVTAKSKEITENRSAYRYQCSVCKLWFIARKALDAHMRVHIEGNVKCKICHIQFTKLSLFHHERRCHPKLSTESTISESRKRSDTKEQNTREESEDSKDLVETKDNGRRLEYHCDLCQLYCYTAKRLEKHKIVHSVGNLKCEVCQVMFTEISLVKHQMRVHQHGKKQSILKAVEDTSVPEMHNTSETSQRSEELLQPIDDTVKRKYRHFCDICNLTCQTAERLENHKRIHFIGNVKCEVCQVTFTQRTISNHKNRSHPGWEKQSILKAVENTTVPEMIGKKQTSLKDFYSAINKRRHTVHISNTIKREHPLFVNRRLSEYREFKCRICDKVLRTQEHLNDHTKSHFQCYICKKYFETISHLSSHLKRHIFYQQWVDPLNVHLSNWSFNQSREILQNQPLVLVENLEIKNINLKSLSQYDQRIQNVINDLDSSKEICSKENEPKNMFKNEVSQYIDEELFKTEDNDVCENYAEQLNGNNNQRPMSQELSNNICVDLIDVDSLLVPNSVDSIMDCAVDSTVIDISSGDESDVEAVDDLSEKFFCYFCERLFHSCDALGVHMDRCTMR